MSAAVGAVGSPAAELARIHRSAVLIALSLLLVLVLGGATVLAARVRPGPVALHAETIAIGPGGAVVEITAADQLVPGSRVLAGMPDSAARAGEQAAWLASGSVPAAEGTPGELVASALLDLHVLSQAYGVPVAGWTPAWRYVWPRDSAFVAAALARTGHLAEAEQILAFLGRVQPESGEFQARYRPDGTGVPDDRGIQLDGVGWALWATAQVAAEIAPAERTSFVNRHRALLDRSTAAALRAVDNPRALPAASADYWEVTERRPTLATAAVLAAGLEAAGDLYALAGNPTRQRAATAAAHRLGASIMTNFGRSGFSRRLGGRPDSADLGVSFLLPPFVAAADPAVVAAWRQAGPAMARPAGGLAPGGSWRRDGVSWTNATATHAMTAAALGDRQAALGWLDWLDRHRTAAGSLPEKVLADGRPASVAPLAWTAAAVIITAGTLAAG